MKDEVIELGSTVRDPVTGVEGVVIGRTNWLHGCTRLLVQAPVGKDGKIPDVINVDEPQVLLVSLPPSHNYGREKAEVAKVVTTSSPARRPTGGPIPMPTRNSTAR